MIYRFRLGRWRFTWTMARTTYVEGVNSILADGNHILMWDFDDISAYNTVMALRERQKKYNLPRIFVLDTGKKNHYIAYCLSREIWETAVEIICGTRGVDLGFIKYGLYRGKFTLRVTPKCGRRPQLYCTLHSKVPESARVDELRSWVHYETLEDGENVKAREVRIWWM